MTEVLWFLVEVGGGGQRSKEKNLDWIHCDLSSQHLLCFHSLYPDENAQTQPVSRDRANGNDFDIKGCGLSHPAVLSVYAQSYLTFLQPYGTITYQAPLSMDFPGKKNWNWFPLPSPGDFPNPGIKPTSLASPALAGGFFTTVPPGKPTFLDAGLLNPFLTRV